MRNRYKGQIRYLPVLIASAGVFLYSRPETSVVTDPAGPSFRDQLARRISEISPSKPDETRQIELKVRDLLATHILSRLNSAASHATPPWELQAALNEDFRQAVWGVSGERALSPPPDIKLVNVLATGGLDTYIVGYDVPYGATASFDVIQCFHETNLGYRLTAEGGHEMDNRILQMVDLGRTSSQDLYFLAYGAGWGANQNPLTVVVYQYDGGMIKAVWSRRDVRNGEIIVLGSGLIVLTHPIRARMFQKEPPHTVTMEYLLTKGEMRLIGKQSY